MKPYRHYSFDLWLTLIRSNPEFKRQRILYFHKHFNHLEKTVEEVSAVFKKVDRLCNAINEKTGKNIDADEMYLLVVGLLNDNIIQIYSTIDTEKLYHITEELFFTYLPEPYDITTIDNLDKLKQLTGATFNILSNTAFIKGSTLRVALQEIGLSKYFDFQLYSDEVGSSKPDRLIFKQMIERTLQLHPGICPDEIIHVGDNQGADVEGAAKAGIHQLLVNSNNTGIGNLLF